MGARTKRTKELTYNYVDRVRLAEHSHQQDYKCPTRGSGWRHNNKSISHLDLATSCHSTAFGPSHWSHNRQLRHSRSLDYAHLTERCKDPLDIAEFYWRLDPEADALYEDEYEDELPDEEEILITRYNGEQRQESPYRDYNYVNKNSQHLHPSHLHRNTSSSGGGNDSAGVGGKTITSTAGTANLQAFDFGSESCSLRRSRSLAVIREETFSDLQITASNNSRRSQLIPRARIVNRGFIRERERLICGSNNNGGNKHYHHHHHHNNGSCNNNLNTSEELAYDGVNVGETNLQHNNNKISNNDLRQRHHHHHHHHFANDSCNQDNLQTQTHPQSPTTVQSTQQHRHHRNQSHPHPQSPQQSQSQSHSHTQPQPQQSREADDYYDNLKRLDALTLGLVEQLHPWHNEKSDLESLNSDYFKNSLHQNHELQQQLDFEALEEAVSFLANEKPRIYQTRRQQRGLLNNSLQKLQNATDSYQENSQSSAFPETTTSNSDDQTDSASLSEQEYDLKKIEKIYKKTTEFEGDEEGYELISLTTTTRTRFETTEEEEDEEEEGGDQVGKRIINFTAQDDANEGVLKRSRALSENIEKLIAYDSVYLSSEEGSESTLNADDTHCEAYEHSTTHVTAKLAAEDTCETTTLLHFSIEDIIYEPRSKQIELDKQEVSGGEGADNDIANHILTETEAVEKICTQTTPQEEQLVSVVERVNTKIENVIHETTAFVGEKVGEEVEKEKEHEHVEVAKGEQGEDNKKSIKKLETTTLYTQILKVGHTSTPRQSETTNAATDTCKFTKSTPSISTSESVYPSITTSLPKSTVTSTCTSVSTSTTAASVRSLTTLTTPTQANLKPVAISTCISSQPTVGITSSAASKPKILSVVEKRKWKRHNETATQSTQSAVTSSSSHNETANTHLRSCVLEPNGSATSSPTIDYTHTPLKRQSTADSLTYLPYHQTNLSDNQYHSLPDVNIGQSLKVSECIDAKLRSSYNVNYTKLNEESYGGREVAKDNTTNLASLSGGLKETLQLETTNKCKLKQQRAAEEVVTSEEIYDSIKRFGRAHQKARQKEYQELHEVHVVKERKREGKEKKSVVKIYDTEKEVGEARGEKKVNEVEEVKELNELKEQTTTYPDSLVEDSVEKAVEAGSEEDEKEQELIVEKVNKVVLKEENQRVETNTHLIEEADKNCDAAATNSSLETNTSEYLEQPKDAPDVEVEDFSKLIERRAKEIKEKSDRRTIQSGTTTITELTGSARIRQLDASPISETSSRPTSDFRLSACVSQFRIIVTDAQNNIIEEDSIEKEDSLSSTTNGIEEEEEATAACTPYAPKLQRVNVFADVTISRQEKKKKNCKDKSTILSTHTHRVASLKRVPSKPKRQHQQQQKQHTHNTHYHNHHFHQQHCCQQKQQLQEQQQQHKNEISKKIVKVVENQNETSQGTDGDDNNNRNYCDLTLKSKERRVLSTQIYKARPIKVLTANDSFRRRSKEGAVTAAGSKMSRPQILHVVDNSKRRSDLFGSKPTRAEQSNNDSQIESEYLKKVDAVRNYWSKLAKNDENEQQEQHQAEGDKSDEVDKAKKVNGEWQMIRGKFANKQENVNELTREVTSWSSKGDEGQQEQQPTQSEQKSQIEQQRPQPELRHFILGAQAEEQPQNDTSNQHTKSFLRPSSSPLNSLHHDEFASFMPSIEIVELDGNKKTTIVSTVPADSADATALANDANGEPQFDHIRYKVLKSQQLLRSNMVPRSKKEAQFDGLIQYLQEYSFQELLANNNVVIVEPVRTKIERPLTMVPHATSTVGGSVGIGAATKQKMTQKGLSGRDNATTINSAMNSESHASRVEQQQQHQQQVKVQGSAQADNGAEGFVTGLSNCSTAGGVSGGVGHGVIAGSGGGIKRHFFYQPVRVNRELYEEELPNPDIVRNVRKFFEENVLATPRGGMQIRQKPPTDDNTFVERSAATQLPSPRARRARKYRYLTIDTSYGHMPLEHRNHQQLAKQQLSAEQKQQPGNIMNNGGTTARKWDTASLSSGISSGDLSSPCECNDADATAKHMANDEGKALKGVHVQAVVQSHNNRNVQNPESEQKIQTTACRSDGHSQLQPRPRPRPRSSNAIRSGDDSTYRVTDIYEQHASQQQQRNFASEGRCNRFGGGETAGTDVDEDADDEDLDDEVGESHYVSKDVLEKIRECGSTVTYYGGRVLQSNSPDPLHYGGVHNGVLSNSNNKNNHQGNSTNTTNTMTLTRRRVRQIESSNACDPPKDCMNQQKQSQQLPLKQNFTKQHIEGQNKNKSNHTTIETADDDNRESSLAHFGIKFKLVKSNSCSSRLELAGTGAEIIETGADDTEVVKKMVHHFECTQQQQHIMDKEEPLTINNQTTAKKLLLDDGESLMGGVGGKTKQVTVNNHINVPMTTYVLDSDTKTTQALTNRNNHAYEVDNKTATEHRYNEKTYESSAMDIRLSNVDHRKFDNGCGDGVEGDGGADGGGGTLMKVRRNKNVDLAYTMVKKQQEQQRQQGKGLSTDSGNSKTTIISSRNGNQSVMSQPSMQPLTATSATTTVANMKKVLESNMALKIGGAKLDDGGNQSIDVQEKTNVRNVEANPGLSCNGSETKCMTDTSVKSQATTTTPILAPRSTQLPAQIVVPVEIHRADPQTPEPYARSISVASSRGSSVTTVITTTNSTMVLDKNVVRQYVANDKSLFEKRKYDDIEFEEFEVYDPTKDYEKLIENEKRREEAKREGQQQQQKSASTALASASAANEFIDSNARYEDDEKEEELKSDSYDYDSLEDKL